jgi:hypothetical protein
MSETYTINFLQSQFNADQARHEAAATLQPSDIFVKLFNAKSNLSLLWNERALDEARKSGPSPRNSTLASVYFVRACCHSICASNKVSGLSYITLLVYHFM